MIPSAASTVPPLPATLFFEGLDKEVELLGIKGIVRKPILMPDLAATIRSALDCQEKAVWVKGASFL